MANVNRREFLKSAAALGAGLAGLGAGAEAAEHSELSPDRKGVLVDTTVCIGCRSCEWACKVAHGLPTPPRDTYEYEPVPARARRPDTTALTVVNRYGNPKDPSAPYSVKVQCMHCDHPACASACIVGALTKNEDGAVVWDSDKCIGCRYCMVACPFQVPAFEYQKALQPRIMKCDFCQARRASGAALPACVENCPVEALTYGPRQELIRVARSRVARSPEKYVDHVYGEFEVGGTSWLYLCGKDPSELQLPKLGKNPAPGVSETIQHGIFAYFMPPVALYSLLGLMMWVSKRQAPDGGEDDDV